MQPMGIETADAPSTRRRGWSWGELAGGAFLLVLLATIFGGATYDVLRPHDRTHHAVARARLSGGTRYSDDLLQRVKAQESVAGSALRATLAKEHELKAEIGEAVQRETHEHGEALAKEKATVKVLEKALGEVQAEEAGEERREEKIVQEELRLLRARQATQ